MQLGDFVRPDEVALHTHAAQYPLHVVKPIDLVGVGGEPNGAAAVPAGRLSGFRLQRLIELDAVVMDLGHV